MSDVEHFWFINGSVGQCGPGPSPRQRLCIRLCEALYDRSVTIKEMMVNINAIKRLPAKYRAGSDNSNLAAFKNETDWKWIVTSEENGRWMEDEGEMEMMMTECGCRLAAMLMMGPCAVSVFPPIPPPPPPPPPDCRGSTQTYKTPPWEFHFYTEKFQPLTDWLVVGCVSLENLTFQGGFKN